MTIKIIDFNVENQKQPTITMVECGYIEYCYEERTDTYQIKIFDSHNELSAVQVVKRNSTVYIMEGGKTIDTIQFIGDIKP